MKKLKKMFRFMFVFAMTIGIMVSVPSQTTKAAGTAKKLVASALKNMKKYTTVSFSFNYESINDGVLRKRSGMGVSSASISHGFYLDADETERGWEEYTKKDKKYRKDYSSTTWTRYTITDYKNKYTDDWVADKKYFQYLLSHLKNIKIVSRKGKFYTITAVPNYKGAAEKKITLTIDKKKKMLTGIKLKYKTFIANYLSSTNKYTSQNRTVTYKNICYGMGSLKLPKGL